MYHTHNGDVFQQCRVCSLSGRFATEATHLHLWPQLHFNEY